ncbi:MULTISPECIES: adenosylcobinamide-phosphate synthase CbiB [unclassified Haematobacter]|uniref:adenosylcobinamide-phosphate synthase CbiB n=1 Tax=unclassified Haematobacter TaxID=2640585 RepID=UPI0025C73368|nr:MULTISPECIES: adenosylcobinamide-phosphate synthase CbiB [unclassified Haematobacter]
MQPLALAAALALDAVFGEPERLWSRVPHPAVLMGRMIDGMDRRFNRGAGRRAKGAVGIGLLVLLALLAGRLVAALPGGGLLEVLAAAVLLAQRSLADHVAAVATGLRASLVEGRRAVARIVGRDTAAMDAPAVARAAIESAAENLSDGVVAPAFWFLVGGLPGILVYKLVNTADSMIGHRTPRHEDFGWAAARLDDLLNLVPARLTALLIALAHGRPDARRVILRDAPLHRSPNAGWPEAAMAAVLGIALSGPRSYHGERQDFPYVNAEGRHDIGAAEIDAAVAALWRTWALMLALVLLVWLIS